jgi:hypothetical protein
MVEDVERTSVRPKRRCRKPLYFTSEKEVQTECGKEECKQGREKKLVEYGRRNCKDIGF